MSRHTWSALEDAILGTAADAVIADRIGTTVSSVRHRRHSLGIAEFVPSPVPGDVPHQPNGDQSLVLPCQRRYPIWPAAVVALFGVCTDREIAKAMGCSPITVSRMRRRAHVPALYEATQRQWSAADDAIVRTHAIAEAATILGVSPQSVARRRKSLGLPTDERRRVDVKAAREMLAKGMTLSSVAREMGVSQRQSGGD